MNKKVLIVFSLVALIFVSCSKDDSETVNVKNGSATITGIARCETDLTNLESEFVPAGTKIIATISTDDLVVNPDPTITYPERSFSTTVGANGKYSLTVDANAKTVTVNITASDFEFDQKIDTIPTYTRKRYVYGNGVVNVVEGVSKIEDLFFNAF